MDVPRFADRTGDESCGRCGCPALDAAARPLNANTGCNVVVDEGALSAGRKAIHRPDPELADALCGLSQPGKLVRSLRGMRSGCGSAGLMIPVFAAGVSGAAALLQRSCAPDLAGIVQVPAGLAWCSTAGRVQTGRAALPPLGHPRPAIQSRAAAGSGPR